jgi:acyl-coenzyme A thioesterase PaaI-like protein
MNLLSVWNLCCRLPFGGWLFSRALGLYIPYTGSIRAHVLDLSSRGSRVAMRDRRRNRNHLRSVHAVALANLGELSTGLALTVALPPQSRIILRRLEIEYLKKARGRLVASAPVDRDKLPASGDVWIHSEIRDAKNELVAKTQALWKVDSAKL